MKQKFPILLAVVMSALGSPLGAAVVASFNFADGPRSDANDAVLIPGISAVSAITSSPTGGNSAEFAIANSGFVPSGTSGWSARAERDADAASSAYAFTITVGTGTTLTLTDFALDSTAVHQTNQVGWPTTTSFAYSLTINGGPAILLTNLASITSTVSSSSPDSNTSTSSASFNTVLGAGVHTFVINPTLAAGSGSNGNQFQRAGYFDNVVLSGTVVPEPGSAALFLIGTLGLLRRRRRA